MQVPIEKEHIEYAGWFAAAGSVLLGCIGLGSAKNRLSVCEKELVRIAEQNYMTTEEYNRRHAEDVKLSETRHVHTISRIDALGDELKTFVETNRKEHNDITGYLIKKGDQDGN